MSHKYIFGSVSLAVCLFILYSFGSETALVRASAQVVSIEMAAAATGTYHPHYGGGAYNDGSNGSDINKQLDGNSLACGDVVTLLMLISVDNSIGADSQVVDLRFSLGTVSSGQQGIAFASVSNVTLNYGRVENGDDGSGNSPGQGQFGLDSAISDDRQTIAGGDTGVGGSTVRSWSTELEPAGSTLFSDAESVLLAVVVDDLEAGESIVLRADAQILCQANANPSGNLRASFDQGAIIEQNGAPIPPEPFSQNNEFVILNNLRNLTGIEEPYPRLGLTVMASGGVCGFDDSDFFVATPNQPAVFCVEVINFGTADLFMIEVANSENHSASNEVNFIGLEDIAGDGEADDLRGNSVANAEYPITFSSIGTFLATFTATANNGLTGSEFINYEFGQSYELEVASPTSVQLGVLDVLVPDSHTNAKILLIAITVLLSLATCTCCWRGYSKRGSALLAD